MFAKRFFITCALIGASVFAAFAQKYPDGIIDKSIAVVEIGRAHV